MRYNCDDIRSYLEDSGTNRINETEFLRHLESCPACSDLILLDRELESLLQTSTAKTLPHSVESELMAKIAELENEIVRGKRYERWLLASAGGLAILSFIMIISFWEGIKTFIGSFGISALREKLFSLISDISVPVSSVSGLASKAAESPYLVISLVAITTILWAFSILETQKSLK